MLFVHDMIHNNPGLAQYDSAFRDPDYLKSRGYDGKTFDLMNSAQLALTWELLDSKNPDREPVFPAGSIESQWVLSKRATLKPLYAEAAAAGISVSFMMDIIVLPQRVVDLYPEIRNEHGKIDILAPKMKEILDCLFDELFMVFPELTGIYIRFGETYIGPKFNAPYHIGNHPILGDEVSYHRFLLNYLREKVCVQYSRDIYYRNWCFTDFQRNREHYEMISSTVEPHEKFFFCVKHTAGDFHRTHRFNPCLNVGRHKQVLEVQLAREYEGKGAYPHYIVDGVLNGFEEYKSLMNPLDHQGLRDLLKQPNHLIAGVWTWSRGGGWGGPYINGRNDVDGSIIVSEGRELWPDVNAYVLVHWCKDPSHSDKYYALAYATEVLGYSRKDAEIFYELLYRSAHAVLLGKGTNSNRYEWNPRWSRDQNISYSVLMDNIRNADAAGELDVLLSERKRSVQEWDTILSFANELPDNNPNTAYIRTTCEYGLLLYRLYEVMYRANIYGHLGGRADLIQDAIIEYEGLWERWEVLARLPGCPTLYARENRNVDLLGYDFNKGFDAAIDPLRRLDENGYVLPV